MALLRDFDPFRMPAMPLTPFARRPSDLHATKVQAESADISESPVDQGQLSWQNARDRLIAISRQGEAFTSVRDLAARVGCPEAYHPMMGNIEYLLKHHREEVLKVLDNCMQAGWQHRGAKFRGDLITCIGSVDGFNLKPNRSWPQVSKGLQIGLRRLNASRLKPVSGMLVQYGDTDVVATFITALIGDQMAAANKLDAPVETKSATASEMPASPTMPELPALLPNAWLDAVPKIEPRLHTHYLVYATSVADSDGSPWQQSAAAAIDDLYSHCIPDADAESDDETGIDVDGDSREQASASNTPASDGEQDFHPNKLSPRGSELTLLDQVLIDVIVQSADDQHGARDAVTVSSILKEFKDLNTHRHQSRYLLGFHAALSGQGLPTRTGAENDQRRAWRVAGWLIGHFRREGDEACNRIEQLSLQDRTAVLSLPDAARTIADRLVGALINQSKYRQVDPWLRFVAPPTLASCADHARRLIRDGKAAEAAMLANAVAGVALVNNAAGPMIFEIMLDAILAQANAERALGRFDRALETVSGAEQLCQRLAEVPEEGRSIVPESMVQIRAEAAAERYLCSMRIKDVDELWFVDDSSIERIRQLLAPASSTLAEIIANRQMPSPAVTYCVALWCILQPASSARNLATETCLPWLETLGAQPGAVALGTCTATTATRLWLMRALLLAREGGPMLSRCIEDIATFESNNPRLPFVAIRDAIENGLTEDAANVDRLITPRLASDVQRFVKSGLMKAAVQKSHVVARLREDLPALLRDLPRADAVAVVVALFGALAENGGKRQDLQAIGDELLALINDFSEGAPDAIEALQHGGRGASIWGEDDYCAIDFELALHCRGPFRDSARYRLMRRASVLERAMRHDEAEECLEMAESLGEPRESTEGLRLAIAGNRAANIASHTTNAAGQVRRVRVLFVGGDDRQRKEQDNIRRLVAAHRRNVEIDFEHPGWGSNWSPKLDTAVRKLPKTDIVVILRFTRTIYGEKLRNAISTAGKQWRPTYGHGAPAIARAIVRAANDFEP